MNLTETQSKILAIGSLGIGSVLVGILPALLTNRSQHNNHWPLIQSALLCLGGGVLFSTSLIHILPEAQESIDEKFKPFIEIIFAVGFFLLYLVDEIVHFLYGEMEHIHYDHGHGKVEDEQAIVDRHNHNNDIATRGSKYGACNQLSLDSALLDQKQPPFNPTFCKAYSDSVLFSDEFPPSQVCHVMHQQPCPTSVSSTNFGLLLALSIHSIIEGLVVGLEDSASKVLLLLGAIASHKLVVGFCLGVELASNVCISFCRHFMYVLVFACASVAGIILGMIVLKIPNDITYTVIPILQALSGGTLLYVTVSEILPRERARWHKQHSIRCAGLIQLSSVLSGLTIMTIFSKFFE